MHEVASKFWVTPASAIRWAELGHMGAYSVPATRGRRDRHGKRREWRFPAASVEEELDQRRQRWAGPRALRQRRTDPALSEAFRDVERMMRLAARAAARQAGEKITT